MPTCFVGVYSWLMRLFGITLCRTRSFPRPSQRNKLTQDEKAQPSRQDDHGDEETRNQFNAVLESMQQESNTENREHELAASAEDKLEALVAEYEASIRRVAEELKLQKIQSEKIRQLQNESMASQNQSTSNDIHVPDAVSEDASDDSDSQTDDSFQRQLKEQKSRHAVEMEQIMRQRRTRRN